MTTPSVNLVEAPREAHGHPILPCETQRCPIPFPMPSSALHEVDHFETVSRGENGGAIVGPADDLAIALDRHRPRVAPEPGQQVEHRRSRRKLPRLAVQDDLEESSARDRIHALDC